MRPAPAGLSASQGSSQPSRWKRALVMLGQVVGTLFVAILIARLAGIYPPKHETERQ